MRSEVARLIDFVPELRMDGVMDRIAAAWGPGEPVCELDPEVATDAMLGEEGAAAQLRQEAGRMGSPEWQFDQGPAFAFRAIAPGPDGAGLALELEVKRGVVTTVAAAAEAGCPAGMAQRAVRQLPGTPFRAAPLAEALRLLAPARGGWSGTLTRWAKETLVV